MSALYQQEKDYVSQFSYPAVGITSLINFGTHLGLHQWQKNLDVHRNLIQEFKKFLRNHGLHEVRLHELRHTCAAVSDSKLNLAH